MTQDPIKEGVTVTLILIGICMGLSGCSEIRRNNLKKLFLKSCDTDDEMYAQFGKRLSVNNEQFTKILKQVCLHGVIMTCTCTVECL